MSKDRAYVFGFLSLLIAFLDDAPINGDAFVFRGFHAFGDIFHPIVYWYLAHAVLMGIAALFVSLAIREASNK